VFEIPFKYHRARLYFISLTHPSPKGGDDATEAAIAEAPLLVGLRFPLPPTARANTVTAAASAATSTRAETKRDICTVAIATPHTTQ
jgi:hypothetical protein